jgi:hypothetical protein
MNMTLAKTLCLLPLAVCSEPRDWGFVASVGGIAVGSAYQTEKGWFLPVHANVSGLEAVTSKPTQINSGLICENVAARLSGNVITLTLYSGVARDGYSSSCPPAALGSLPPGNYHVIYQSPGDEPHLIGEVVLGSNNSQERTE